MMTTRMIAFVAAGLGLAAGALYAGAAFSFAWNEQQLRGQFRPRTSLPLIDALDARTRVDSAVVTAPVAIVLLWAPACSACEAASGSWLLAAMEARERVPGIAIASAALTADAERFPFARALADLGGRTLPVADADRLVRAAGGDDVPVALVLAHGCVMGGVRGTLGPRRTAALLALIDQARIDASIGGAVCSASRRS